MRTLSEQEFLSWAEARGLSLNPQYPESAVLAFHDDSTDARFWDVPTAPERRPYFLASLLDLCGDWTSCFVWRHLGSWPSLEDIDTRRINDVVEHQLLSGIGLPMGTADVVEFTHEDYAALICLLLTTTIFGWSVGEDLYILPNHARYLLQTDHHNVCHVVFRDGNDVPAWEAEMSRRGFPLPDEVPDATFKPPPWMQGPS